MTSVPAGTDRERADGYEYALTLLHGMGDGDFLAITKDEQAVVEDAIRRAVERRNALAAVSSSPATTETSET